MQHDELSTVTVCGRIADWCVAVGTLAENIRRFGAVGAEVLGWGRLDRLAFVNPKEVGSILGWDLQ